jgi:hypothetical protein
LADKRPQTRAVAKYGGMAIILGMSSQTAGAYATNEPRALPDCALRRACECAQARETRAVRKIVKASGAMPRWTCVHSTGAATGKPGRARGEKAAIAAAPGLL